MTGPPPVIPPPSPDFQRYDRRCPKCRQLVGEDGFCPDCHVRKATNWAVGLFILSYAFAAVGSYYKVAGISVAAIAGVIFLAIPAFVITAMVAHRLNLRKSERATPGIAAARKAEKLARVNAGFLLAPPTHDPAIPRCPRCGSPLDDAGWCTRCSSKRREKLVLSICGASAVAGLGACAVGTGMFGYRNPPLWMNVLAGAGMVLFFVVPAACILWLVVVQWLEKRGRK